MGQAKETACEETLSKGTVLVVDDETVNCDVLISLLNGYKVLVAKNGEQAIERSNSHPPDLILLDVVMPGISGYDVCKRLKEDENTASIPIIFVTMKSTIEEEAKGLQLGAVDYISKPFSPAIVQARVNNHMQLKRQRDLLESLNVTDSLTGISNRRHFDRALIQNWQSASRTKSDMALLMIDIDHFKQFNDHYGHQAGDECLSAIAKTLALQSERELDLICRYGGEEFAAILPHTDLHGAELIAGKLIAAVRELELPHEASPTSEVTTVSIGVACTQASPFSTCEKLVEKADELLYQAKRLGRNRFVSTAY